MNAIERAQAYAAIFLKVGDHWSYYVPVDATVCGDDVYLQGVHMEQVEDGWQLTENGRSCIVKLAVDA